MPWFVVAEERKDDGDEDSIWTVSQDPEQCGWETDCGYPGYGLPKSVAQFLADAANEKEQREGRPFPLLNSDEELGE